MQPGDKFVRIRTSPVPKCWLHENHKAGYVGTVAVVYKRRIRDTLGHIHGTIHIKRLNEGRKIMSAHVKFSVDQLRGMAYEASETAKFFDRKDLPLNAAIQRDIAEALTDYAQHLKEHEDEQTRRDPWHERCGYIAASIAQAFIDRDDDRCS